MSIYTHTIRPFLFCLDPERIHSGTISLCEALGRSAGVRSICGAVYGFQDPRLRTRVAGIDYPNPLGLAAGFDKNGRAVDLLASLGFGSIEIGSVSAYPSGGSPDRPRLFRLPADDAVVVYYGVPNEGSRAVARRLTRSRLPVPLGINLVETNTGVPSGADEAIEEMVEAARPFLRVAHYIALNLNCPNTTGGGSPFDDPGNIAVLLEGYRQYEDVPPVFLKIPPTTDPTRIDAVLEAVDPFAFLKGVIFNLPPGTGYPGLKTPSEALSQMPGTLAGRPTRALINDSIRAWYSRMDRARHVLVGVGGIFCAEDAYEKIGLGASLVQLNTALVYRGAGIAGAINQGLCHLLERDGLGHISEAVGIHNQGRP